jgi:hypothetical protein
VAASAADGVDGVRGWRNAIDSVDDRGIVVSAEREVRVLLARALLEPCLLCGGRPHGAGIFAPYDSERWGARTGKQRLLAYSLCEDCETTSTSTECEDEMARRLGVAA